MSSNITAQEKNAFDLWLESYNKGIDLYNTSNFSDAIPHFVEALKYIDNIDFSTSEETQLYPVENYYNLGVSYLNINDIDNSILHLESALKYVNKLSFVDIDLVTGFMADLGHAYAQKDLHKALNYREEVIKRLNISGHKDLVYAINLYKLAFNYYYLNETDDFYINLIEVEKILNQIGETKSDYYAFTVYYLGNYYFNNDDYKSAHKFLSLSEKFQQYLNTFEMYNYIETVFINAVALFNIEENQKALDKIDSIINDDYFKQEENALLYTQIVDRKAILLHKLQRIDEANKTYLNSLSNIRIAYGEDTKYYAFQNANYGQFLIEREYFEKASIYLEKANSLYKNLNLTNSDTYHLLLNSLGSLNLNRGNYKKAETYFTEALKMLNNEDIPNLEMNKINILNNLALIYQSNGEYEKAKTIYSNILDRKKATLTENNSDYATSLMNYGNMLFESGQYYEAETIYKKALSIFENTIGKNDIMYAKQLLSLGQFYIITRQLKKGLNVFNDAIEIYKASDLNQSAGMGLAIAGKGVIQQHLGEIENSTQTQLKGLELIKKSLSTNNIEYGKIAKNLGLSYHISRDFEKAIYYYKQAFSTYKKSLKDGHYLYGLLLYQIADTQFQTGQKDEALKNLDKAIENFKSNFGDDSFWYTTAMISKGAFTLNAGNYKTALHIFNSLETVIDNVLESDSDIKNILFYQLGVSHELNGNNLKATAYYYKYNEGFKKLLKDVFTYRSENEKKQFLKQFEITLSWLNNSIFNTTHQLTGLIQTGLNNQLMLKGLLLNSTKDLLSELSENGSDAIKTKVASFRLLRKERENLINNPSDKNEGKLNQLKTQINDLENELVRLYNESNKFEKTSIDKDWKAIQSQLKPNEIALEYSVFYSRDGANITKEKAYGVYLIHKNWDQPKAIELFSEDDLKTILNNQTPNTLYQTRGSQGGSSTDTKGLYDLIWAPIEPYLEGIETIYFSPTGLLNQIPFAALDTTDKPILASQYNMVQLSSTYSLTEPAANPNTTNTLFIGGIDYEYTSSGSSANSDTASNLAMLKSVSGTRSMGSKWNYLPGTLDEVSSIKNLFKDNGKTHTLLSSKEATETAFKQLSGNSPNTIHIATHGFFFENPKTNTSETLDIGSQNIYKASEDPLLRSGLIFAGANEAWTKGVNPNSEDDGILTALEISNLDLSNTDLVVLSACETGLGDIDGSEGVYGLQRAFKMAGVDLIIMSLWEVPDTETAEFMQSFYSNWLSGQEIRQAFRNTQLTMAEKYENNPEKWAAFVLFE